jgi:hypothetical protein
MIIKQKNTIKSKVMSYLLDYQGSAQLPVEPDPELEEELKECKSDEERNQVFDRFLAKRLMLFVKTMVIGFIIILIIVIVMNCLKL